MYRSKEIRWFSENPDPGIIKWFAGRGLTFENTPSRDDHYLPLEKVDLSVKLRGGNIEAKHRVGERTRGLLAPNAEGVFENWVKWSFKVDPEDRLSNDIIHLGKYDWVRVTKKRMGVKITSAKPPRSEILGIDAFIDSGYQIEYTEIRLKGATFFTFGLEWFGGSEIQPHPLFLKEILGDSNFGLEESMGYSQFILKHGIDR